jgi:hypothetical protein
MGNGVLVMKCFSLIVEHKKHLNTTDPRKITVMFYAVIFINNIAEYHFEIFLLFQCPLLRLLCIDFNYFKIYEKINKY